VSLKIYPRGEIVPLAITPDSAAQMIAAPGGSARPRSAMKPPEHALNRELLALLGAPSRESSILARYWGFDTRGPETLQRIGNDLGLTGERVRQIVDRQSTLALPGRVAAPVLDQAIRYVTERIPAPAAHLEHGLHSAGFVSPAFRLEALVKAAELFDRSLPLSITRVRGTRIAHPLDTSSLESIVQIARATIRHFGASTISEITWVVNERGSESCKRDLVTSVLTAQKKFQWIDERTGWFWLADVGKNRLVPRIRKILSVANPIEGSVLCAGVERDYRMGDCVPPEAILLRLCGQLEGFSRRARGTGDR